MQPVYPQIFVPQLVNIEVAFQHYLQVLAEVTTAFELGVDSAEAEKLRLRASEAREAYHDQHVCLSMLVLSLVPETQQ
ncbi:TPA: hypothetical protein SLU73_003506 [Pseudomonas aeruginosa]|uniref:hypothetical protein n=1 Tax=Pseudomonas aeruginosa TaxID=287 RepID=UPI00071C1475|nr:hypothetical protein [Pseudomonas aeruginosa]KSD38330.1 hypothetical protein AO902_07735 [Pseudomonas aeruginosa]HEK4017924.1 hypothetical protein [Pseudomonas aeruginosa]